jgi:hypothetical protein
MHLAVILANENTQLHAVNQRRKQKQQQRQRYIAQGGALQAQEGQRLIEALDNVEVEEAQREAAQVRQRAPPTCSNCRIQGHNRRQCTST